jgi:hypothetical protein
VAGERDRAPEVPDGQDFNILLSEIGFFLTITLAALVNKSAA